MNAPIGCTGVMPGVVDTPDMFINGPIELAIEIASLSCFELLVSQIDDLSLSVEY